MLELEEVDKVVTRTGEKLDRQRTYQCSICKRELAHQDTEFYMTVPIKIPSGLMRDPFIYPYCGACASRYLGLIAPATWLDMISADDESVILILVKYTPESPENLMVGWCYASELKKTTTASLGDPASPTEP